MNFKLRRPCKDCPFRSDRFAFLTPARAKDIGAAVAHKDQTFTCHKTIDYSLWDEEDDPEGENRGRGEGEQMCAGALLFIENVNPGGNYMVRLAQAVGLYDPTKLRRDVPVFATLKAFIKAQSR